MTFFQLTNGANIGKNMVIVAGLLATSVTEVTITHAMRTTLQIGNEPSGVILFPIHCDSPETCNGIMKIIALRTANANTANWHRSMTHTIFFSSFRLGSH